MKIQMSIRNVLELVMQALNNDNIKAAKRVLQDCLDQMPKDEKPKLNEKIN